MSPLQRAAAGGVGGGLDGVRAREDVQRHRLGHAQRLLRQVGVRDALGRGALRAARRLPRDLPARRQGQDHSRHALRG